MTISTTIIKNSYSGDASTTVFAYAFKIVTTADIEVIIRSSAGVETTKTLTTHYSVSGAGVATGGNVTMVTAPASGETLVIRRSTTRTQAVDLVENDPFTANSVEGAFDKNLAISQEVQEELDRAIKVSKTNTITSSEFADSASDRANKALGFDDDGDLTTIASFLPKGGDSALFQYSTTTTDSDPSGGYLHFNNTTISSATILYVDDLGYGDIGSYGATGVSTPNIDALAMQGIRFTDAHSSAATCTPSRYSLLTGQYAFRNNAAILPGDAPLIIDHTKPTLPAMLKRAGYTTGVVGKWHLGLGDGAVDWNNEVKPGPIELGFDYSFLLPATGDRVPTVYLENHHVVGLDKNDPITVSYEKRIGDRPVGTESPELLKQTADLQHSATIVNGISRIGWMKGGKSAEWVDENFPHVFTQKAKSFIAKNKAKPFMLFFPFHDIHVPRVPNKMFAGKSPMGVRGDAIAQMDWISGQIIDELKKQGVFDNTLIIFSSDNGPVLDDGYNDQAAELVGQHDPSGAYRGGKYSAYEAGTRVPMIVTYPNGLKAKGDSAALISHIDLYRSFATLTNTPLLAGEAIDSENVLTALLDANKPARTEMLEESFTLSLRDGDWKYIAPFKGTTPDWLVNKDIENGLSSTAQLYRLEHDKKEKTNLIEQYPEQAKAMQARIEQIVAKQQGTFTHSSVLTGKVGAPPDCSGRPEAVSLKLLSPARRER